MIMIGYLCIEQRPGRAERSPASS